MLDEIQTLTQNPKNEDFIASLRTALDINKDQVKVIFTGSSQEGLRRMFSQAKAPFFHFGHNLPFPNLEKGFTNHLAEIFHKVTRRSLNKDELWDIFVSHNKIPHFIRLLVERMALQPDLDLESTAKELSVEIYDNRAFEEIWKRCSDFEKVLLLDITYAPKNFKKQNDYEIKEVHSASLFSKEYRTALAKDIGTSEIPISTIQSALRTLKRKNLIAASPSLRGSYSIDDPAFENWLRANYQLLSYAEEREHAQLKQDVAALKTKLGKKSGKK